MDFSDVFKDSLRYPFSDLKRLIALLLLSIGGILLIPGLIAYGYILRIIKSTLKGEDSLPDFNHLGDLFIDGIKFLIVSMIYGIPALIFNFILYHQVNYDTLAIDWTNPFTITISFIIGFLVSIVFVIALANMAYEERFGAAFAFKRIFQLIKMIGWKKYLSYIVVYLIIANIITGIPLVILIFLIHPSLTITSFIGFSSVLTINTIFSAYMLAFAGRFRGLIYPINEENEKEDNN